MTVVWCWEAEIRVLTPESSVEYCVNLNSAAVPKGSVSCQKGDGGTSGACISYETLQAPCMNVYELLIQQLPLSTFLSIECCALTCSFSQ